jgi:hypothetical protein
MPKTPPPLSRERHYFPTAYCTALSDQLHLNSRQKNLNENLIFAWLLSSTPTSRSLPYLYLIPAIMSNEAAVHEDLVPEQTEGFKVGEKKTIDEYQKLGKSRKDHIAAIYRSPCLHAA